MRAPVHRRHFLKIAGSIAGTSLLAGRGAAAAIRAPGPQWSGLIDKAEAALDRFSDRLAARDRYVVVDFALASSEPRMLLVDRAAGKTQLLRVAHGRGSDPAHSGWLQRFSNEAGSNASSRGAYVTGTGYVGGHGRSQRLIGLETSNDQAEARAIVIHGAWYCNADILKRTGKLGRSEGCFAVAEDTINPLLDWLGPGRLLYADKI